MPAISSDPGIMAAAKTAIDVLLSFKGFPIVIERLGAPIPKPGGGHDAGAKVALPPQTFVLTQNGPEIVEDGTNGDTQVVRRQYYITGLFDADLQIDDTWSDDLADYRVQSVDNETGYKTTGDVVAFVKAT